MYTCPQTPTKGLEKKMKAPAINKVLIKFFYFILEFDAKFEIDLNKSVFLK